MARIVIAAYGSRGDLAPLTDFGARLRGDGHDVVMTATPDLVDDITVCGIAARPVDFEMDADIENPARAAMQLVLPEGMRQLGRTCSPHSTTCRPTSCCCPRSPNLPGILLPRREAYPVSAFGCNRCRPQPIFHRRCLAGGRRDRW